MSGHQHSWRFWGDDPYVICDCGEVQDAISGQIIRAVLAVVSEEGK